MIEVFTPLLVVCTEAIPWGALVDACARRWKGAIALVGT